MTDHQQGSCNNNKSNPCNTGAPHGFLLDLFSLLLGPDEQQRQQQQKQRVILMTGNADVEEEGSSSSVVLPAAAAAAEAVSVSVSVTAIPVQAPEQALDRHIDHEQPKVLAAEPEQSRNNSSSHRHLIVRTNTTASSDSHYDHALSHAHRCNNTSEVENMALKIENRRAQRMPVTWNVRHRFLRDCYKIAPIRIPLAALLEYRKQVQQEVDLIEQQATIFSSTLEWLGFRNTSKVLLQVLDRAVIRVQDELNQNDWFYYQDFSFYFTRIESKWPFMRNAFHVSIWMFITFYIGTAVLFCSIMQDPGVCPRNDDLPGYSGWLTAVYFASTTMATVGYGDVSVMLNKGGGNEPPAKWRIFIGAMYMIVSLLMVIVVFSSIIMRQATSKAPSLLLTASGRSKKVNSISTWLSKLKHYIYGPPDIQPGELLSDKIRRVRIAKLGVICIQFFVLNLVGMFICRIFVSNAVDEDERWSWMETFYWSIQTTTTIGYGDMAMPFEMRWFQVFYLLISTYFVGDALGKVGSYNEEIRQLRRFFAWNRREVSQGMIEDWQADEHDDKINQYEFALASLLDLGTITHADLQPIMAKFRGLAGPKGYICMEEDFDQDGTRREASTLFLDIGKSEDNMSA